MSGRLSGDIRNAIRRVTRHSGGADRYSGGVQERVPVIGKIAAPRGEHVEGLIYYLYGPGRREQRRGGAPPGRARAAAETGWRPGFPAPARAPQPAARRDGHVGTRPPGVALLDARRAGRQDAVRR
jgi:hypothetical protein